MAPTIKLGGEQRPPTGPESAPSAKPRAKRAAPRSGSAGGGGSSSAAATPEPRMSAEDKKLHSALVRMYTMIGVGMTGIAQAKGDLGLATAGVNVTSIASDTADAWIELAQQNPKVRQALNGLVAGGAVANLIGCHVGMIAPVLASRGAIPAGAGMMFLSDDAKQFFVNNNVATAPPASE